jgi:uncharacterized protein
MSLSSARTLLFYFPFVCLGCFILGMVLAPSKYKMLVYGVFFNQGFWLAVPYAIVAFATAVFAARARRWITFSFVSVLGLAGCIAFYARFIEPSRIVVREHTIEFGAPLRIAFIADPHIGFFDGKARMQQIVDALNGLNVDVVAVGGDWSYEPTEPLVDLLAPIAASRHRVIAVMGNHDEGMPGMRVAAELEVALKALKVELIEGRTVDVKGIQFVGLGDRFADKDKVPPLAESSMRLVALGHNPDSIDRLRGTPIRLLLAGHTHGGQINVPFFDRTDSCAFHRRQIQRRFVHSR